MTRTCGTMLEDASVWPLAGNVVIHGPPERVEADTTHGIWPDPAFRMSMFWGDGGPPPCTVKNESPVSGIRSVWVADVTVIVTGTVSFWLEYLDACRELASRCGVSLRTLDKALWQYSKERSAAVRKAAPV